MKNNTSLLSIITLSTVMVGCNYGTEFALSDNAAMVMPAAESPAEMEEQETGVETQNDSENNEMETQEFSGNYQTDTMCNGNFISQNAVEEMLWLTDLSDNETIYTTFDRVDAIASLFELCGDPWGLFPTTYRQITKRGLNAIAAGDFNDEAWGRDIIVDFASRYMGNLRAALQGDEPSWAWRHYYELADNPEVSKTRSVLVAMSAHLMLDLPHSLVAIDTQEEHKEDFFVFGELMIEVADDLIADLRTFHNCDAHAMLNGFFLGEWVDGMFGYQTTITISYQTIRTKAWNGRWYLEQPMGKWVAHTEIWSSFWATDGVLSLLDASGAI